MMKRKVHARLFCTVLAVILLFSTLALSTTAVTLDESVNPEASLLPEIAETIPPVAEIIESEENPYLKAGDLTLRNCKPPPCRRRIFPR
ncbi:MAG: hypothetical protein IJ009_02010 [Clostridia bacterium]|nr:hypothetical protein [Clostridia bacterium]